MKVKSYKDLDVWKKGIEIAGLVYEMTDLFPEKERFNLMAQMQRAAVSISSNIAEGSARQHTKEYQQHCYIALGSCAELETQLIIAGNRNYVSDAIYSRLAECLGHESRMLMNLIKSLR